MDPVAFDSNVFIYMLGSAPEFRAAAKAALRPILDGRAEGFISSLVITEVVAGLPPEDTMSLEFFEHPHIHVVPVSRAIATLAGSFRATHPALRTVDAVHIATALSSSCKQFVTNDLQLTKLPLGVDIVPLAHFHEAEPK